MSTETSLTILVVILSTVLLIFLILGIILLVKLIQISDTVKHVTEKAEQIADRAEALTAMAEKAAPPVVFGRLVNNIMEAVNKSKRRKGRDDDDE